MKTIIALALTLLLFGCKEKNETSAITLGLVGDYKATSTKPSYIFQELLTDYDNFNETTIATNSQTGINTYLMKIQTIGVARKGVSTPVNYGFTAEMNCQYINSTEGNYAYGCIGKYSNLTPYNTQLDSRNKEINAYLTLSGYDLKIVALIPYQEDLSAILITTLRKEK